ncbi:MAG: hypothetical protein IJK53_07345 [Erysipelotrichaceae bacterium]|nr:hypothetical protein [Clostridia bacterium]MBQ6217184.1 hypothetical protein [Erysipelotrichaceae bacterium]
MFSGFFIIFVDIFRQLLWWIVSALFFLMDAMFDVCKSLAGYDLMSNSKVWTYYEGFTSAFLGFFIIFRLFKRYLKSITDEEEMHHMDPISILLKIASVGFVIALAPFLLRSIGRFTSLLIENIESIMGSNNTSYSGFFLSSIGMKEGLNYTDITSAGINLKLEDGSYQYLNSMTDFLCIFISSAFSSFIMVIIAMQIGSRYMSMIMKLILAPWSISSLVEERSDSFSNWCKLFLADFMANYLQLLLLVLGGTFVLNL